MTGMIDHILNQDGYLITASRDAHGDQIETSRTAIKCKFRYVTGIEKGVSAEALGALDAIIWLASDSTATEGSLIEVDGHTWRVDRLVKARRLSGSTIEFLKAYVQKHSI